MFRRQRIHAICPGNSDHWTVKSKISHVIAITLLTVVVTPATLYARDCSKEATSGAAISCLQDRIQSLSEQLERFHEEQVQQGGQQNHLFPLFLDTVTNNRGHFIANYDFGAKYDHIFGLLVAVQHKNGSWNTIDTSNAYNNTFFWNRTRVEGWINRKDDAFANRPVRIVMFLRE